MYTVGARTATLDAFASTPESHLTLAAPADAPAPVASAARAVPVSSRAPAPRAVRQTSRPVDTREVRRNEADRSWSKTALIIGGSAASGAGVGGVVNGKKGALIGAAIGGGAASIYEATQRR
jgi:hypothetical protein